MDEEEGFKNLKKKNRARRATKAKKKKVLAVKVAGAVNEGASTSRAGPQVKEKQRGAALAPAQACVGHIIKSET